MTRQMEEYFACCHKVCLPLESRCTPFVLHSLYAYVPIAHTGHKIYLTALNHQLLSASPLNRILLENRYHALFVLS